MNTAMILKPWGMAPPKTVDQSKFKPHSNITIPTARMVRTKIDEWSICSRVRRGWVKQEYSPNQLQRRSHGEINSISTWRFGRSIDFWIWKGKQNEIQTIFMWSIVIECHCVQVQHVSAPTARKKCHYQVTSPSRVTQRKLYCPSWSWCCQTQEFG